MVNKSLTTSDSTEAQEKRYRYLLGQTDLFAHFIKAKQEGKSVLSVLLEKEGSFSKPKKRSKQPSDRRHHHKLPDSGAESEDEQMMAEMGLLDTDEEHEKVQHMTSTIPSTVFTESPPFIRGGKMRPYQVQGLNWLISLYENHINGILADEMGLGKTLQTLSLLGYLKHVRMIDGPHLLVVPKSTLQNWLNEANKWIPDLRAFILHGTKEERAHRIETQLLHKPRPFDLCITSYEICLLEKASLRKVQWHYLAIDEAHRIKNEQSMLSQIVREFRTEHRLLITGTPLQNNLHELWALLNFLLPDVFSSAEDFDAWFGEKKPEEDQEKPQNDAIEEEESRTRGDEGQLKKRVQESDSSAGAKKLKEGLDSAETEASTLKNDAARDSVVQQLRRLLQPFLLRRLKIDVEHSLLPKKEVNLYTGMSDMQRTWYQRILERDLEAVNGLTGKGSAGKTRLLNIVMQLRKACNHPYLFEGAEPGPPFTTDEHLVTNCAKMQILDALLKRFKAKGSRVLLFSQMSRMLDILEDYCLMRGWQYCRIDGSTAHEDRISAIEEYNRPGSEKFIFLLTTRAGGLGINLATADIVILYDSDWNPQVDLQAQDRAHRIGQTKQVCIFRLITESSIEEKVIERALQKLRLDQLVIQQGVGGKLVGPQSAKPPSHDEMLAMIRFGAQEIMNRGSAKNKDGTEDINIEELLMKGETKTRELHEKYKDAGLDDLQRFESSVEWTGVAGAGSEDTVGGLPWLQPDLAGRRERAARINYAALEWGGEGGAGASNTGSGTGKRRPPLPPGHPHTIDFYFFPQELKQLLERERLVYQREHGWKPEDLEEQKTQIEAKPLSEAEQARREHLLRQESFITWTRRDFQNFCRASERHGRDQLSAIAAEVEGKTQEEVKRFAGVFWKRLNELQEAERILGAIERGEARIARTNQINTLLDRFLNQSKKTRGSSSTTSSTPVLHLPYQMDPTGNVKGKLWTEEEDLALIQVVAHLRYNTESGGLGVGQQPAQSPTTWDLAKAELDADPRFILDWFLRTRTPAELSKRFHKLVGLLEKEAAASKEPMTKTTSGTKKQSTHLPATASERLSKARKLTASRLAEAKKSFIVKQQQARSKK